MKAFAELPLLPLRGVVVYPHMTIPLFVGREKSIEALGVAMTGDRQIFLLTQKSPTDGDLGEDGLYRMGTVATVLQLLKLSDDTVEVLVEGGQHGQVERFIEEGGYIYAAVQAIDDANIGEHEIEVFTRNLLSQSEQYVQLDKKAPAEMLSSLSSIDEPSRLVDTMAAHMALKVEQKQDILGITDLSLRIEHILTLLDAKIDLLQVEKRIHGRIKKQMGRSQREYYLNKQMEAIQKELGDIGEGCNEVEELKKRISTVGLIKEARTKATTKLNKLRQMSPMSAEATVMRSYTSWLLNVPWEIENKVRHDLAKMEDILDADHYGLEEVKECIPERLAMQKRIKKLEDPILCLVGPPGVGKTSLAESIARTTNCKFVRMALGGVRDEAEIRGHRRTYIDSMPGRLIQKMTKVGARNPLPLLDEIDKVDSGMREDPASALFEVLDPKQNHNFNDRYLEVDYNLSNVMFLCTANSMNIPAPLLDRMEVIRLPDCAEDERVDTASKYLIPKQIQANGLRRGKLTSEKGALRDIIRYYIREAGIRSLERQVTKTCRKAVKEYAKLERVQAVVSSETLENHLGVHKFRYSLAE